MRWRGRRQSSNVDDIRGGGSSYGPRYTRAGTRGRGIRLPRGRGGKIGGIGTVIVFLVAVFVFDVNPLTLLGGDGLNLGGPSQNVERPADPGEGDLNDEMGRFAATILADTESTWGRVFRSAGETYQEPRLVLFTGEVVSACGQATSATGPFYCPGDSQVYIDLGFFEDLKTQFDAPGDFAQAYVIAHEVGHHVQNLMGIMSKFQSMRGRISQSDYNALSVRIELQADCFAGIWGHYAAEERNYLENGDIEEALNAAAQIGDDAIQRRTQGYVVPDSFNHGASAQRMRWFRKGLESGSVDACDTINAERL